MTQNWITRMCWRDMEALEGRRGVGSCFHRDVEGLWWKGFRPCTYVTAAAPAAPNLGLTGLGFPLGELLPLSGVIAPLRFGPPSWWWRTIHAKFEWMVLWSQVPVCNATYTNLAWLAPLSDATTLYVTTPRAGSQVQPDLWGRSSHYGTHSVLIILMCILYTVGKNIK